MKILRNIYVWVKNCFQRAPDLSSLRGNVVIYIVMVILIFGVLGVTVASLFTTSTTSTATPNYGNRTQWLAEAGIRYALSEVRNSNFSETTIQELNNTTYKFADGTFEVNIFSPWFISESDQDTTGGTVSLGMPNGGQLPDDLTIPNILAVNFHKFAGESTDNDNYAEISSSDTSVSPPTITVKADDRFVALENDTICLAVKPYGGSAQTLPENGSLKIPKDAQDFFPEHNAAFTIKTGSDTYNLYYKRILDTGDPDFVTLEEIAALPGAQPWPTENGGLINVNTDDYVILSPYNFRIHASGTSGDVTAKIDSNKALTLMSIKEDTWTITQRELIEGSTPLQEYDSLPLINTELGALEKDDKIILGGDKGFGTLTFGGNKSVPGNSAYCSQGECFFDEGIRVFFTLNYSGDGEGFTFAIVNAANNDKGSVGGDSALSELLAYAGNGRINATTYLGSDEEGFEPPKMALEFDTRTNYVQPQPYYVAPLSYCDDPTTIKSATRNDPKPFGEEMDVLQYVFWGNTSLDIECRADHPSYDDNRHDAEGDEHELEWTYLAADEIYSSATVDPFTGNVYFGSYVSNGVNTYGLDPDGNEIFRRRHPSSGGLPAYDIISQPALEMVENAEGEDERVIYFTAMDGYLYALKPDGTLRWRRVSSFPQGIETDPVTYPSTGPGDHWVYFGGDSDYFYGLAATATGWATFWAYDTNNSIQGSPTVDSDGIIYLGTNGGHVFAFDPSFSTLTYKWKFTVPDAGSSDKDIDSKPAIYDYPTFKRIWVVSDNKYMYSYDRVNPAPTFIWDEYLGTEIDEDPLVVREGENDQDVYVYIGNRDGNLYKFRGTTGQKPSPWPIDIGSGIYSSPNSGPDGTIYIGTNGNVLWAYNPDGTEKWGYPDNFGPNDIRVKPAVSEDSRIYYGDLDGNFYAIKDNTALPTSRRNRYLTSDKHGTEVAVSDEINWLQGIPATRNTWAVRMEITRETISGNKGKYVLKTWLRQCANLDCSDIVGTKYAATQLEYDYSPVAAMPFAREVVLSDAEHAQLDRFLFGFTTAADTGDTQEAVIQNFELTFIRNGTDPVETYDADWDP